MTSCLRVMAYGFGLSIWSWTTTVTSAHEPRANAQFAAASDEQAIERVSGTKSLCTKQDPFDITTELRHQNHIEVLHD